MTMPKHQTIGARLGIAFALSTLLLLVVSLVAWTTWSRLEGQVGVLLGKSVPKYNASYLLESRSAEIRRHIDSISHAENKVALEQYVMRLDQDLTAINQVLDDLEVNTEQQKLKSGYAQLHAMSERFSLLVSQGIDQRREVALLQEQVQWVHQDISSELVPLRQEIQWQLEREISRDKTVALVAELRSLQSILDSEAQIFSFFSELLSVNNHSQVDNGLKILQFRLDELYTLSVPLFSQPASIAYQQLLSELVDVLKLEGPLHRHLTNMVALNSQLTTTEQEIKGQVAQLHHGIASLVDNADEVFVQIKLQTTELVSYGNRILLACFSLSIVISLFITYYFIHRRIIGRLNNLSRSLDAIIKNDLSHPIVVDGKDEIGQISEKLIQYGEKTAEMERTNALSLINNTQASLITCDLNGIIESANANAHESLNIVQDSRHHAFWQCFSASVQPQVKRLFLPDSVLLTTGADMITLCLGDFDNPYYIRLYLRQYTQGLQDKLIITITDVTEQEIAQRILEQRVKEKTQSLREKNQQLVAEIEERERTEAHLKATQNELLQAAKMAVVGQTMTSLAHELNQPLNAMSAYLYSAKLAAEHKQVDQVIPSLQQVENLAERMGKMVNGLRNFARKTNQDEPLASVSLASVLEQVLLLTQVQAKRLQVRLTNHIQVPLNVIADNLGLEQVLINLIVNACEAVSGTADKQVQVIYLGSDPTCHRIAICDSGIGFDHEVVTQLFIPFTTTKAVGLGLGLSICKSLIEKMHGQIYLGSTLAGGAMVILELPYE
ncbi:ATP-binding protein [Motilimonas sp. E26]|uniref:ATP-binding protein n=1 Tax=Motilimonas sp. E26 TaxID=2865674 RepID=UPI001E571F80|nr:ATP-binding protein [Motilimonas sp. E26]MCE0559331.1 HAMP domain-containing protein [Motilimonas sp. E26]